MPRRQCPSCHDPDPKCGYLSARSRFCRDCTERELSRQNADYDAGALAPAVEIRRKPNGLSPIQSGYVPKARYRYRCGAGHVELTCLPPDKAFCVAAGICRRRDLELLESYDSPRPHVPVMETPLTESA